MKLLVLFGQRKESYDGEHAPEALACWTEYDAEGNPEGWEAAVAEGKKTYGSDMITYRVIEVWVNQAQIRDLLIGTGSVQGKIVG